MFISKMLSKTSKIVTALALASFLSFGLAAGAWADAPAPDFKRVHKVKKVKRVDTGLYEQYKRPAVGYDFRVRPLDAQYYVPQW